MTKAPICVLQKVCAPKFSFFLFFLFIDVLFVCLGLGFFEHRFRTCVIIEP